MKLIHTVAIFLAIEEIGKKIFYLGIGIVSLLWLFGAIGILLKSKDIFNEVLSDVRTEFERGFFYGVLEVIKKLFLLAFLGACMFLAFFIGVMGVYVSFQEVFLPDQPM